MPQWYNSSGTLENAWDSRGTSGQLLKAEGDGTVSWATPSSFRTRGSLLAQSPGGRDVNLSSSMLNYALLSITVQCTNYHSASYKPFWQILLVPSLFYDYCSRSSGNCGLFWSLYLESAGYLNIFATSPTSLKWSGTYDDSMYTMYVHGINFALN